MNKNTMYHTLFAGWCADAVGARLEFLNTRLDQKHVDDAMRFQRESSVNIPVGQYTDDTEMELCLLDGLLKATNEYPLEEIAKNYIQWFKTGPPDIGYATRNAIQGATNHEDMIQNANDMNKNSESNGLMMRCIPIAIFFYNYDFRMFVDLLESESQLTHPSKVVSHSAAVYCFIIAKILHCNLLKVKLNIDGILNEVKRVVENNKVLEWMNEGLSITDISTYDCKEGHVKHAFIMFIFFFKHINEYTYETAIRQVLMNGGKTNAKIIGNLFGAYYGDCVPEYMKRPVLESKSIRPYNIFYANKLANKLILKLNHKN